MRAKGVDVSRWQLEINWQVLSTKVDFAFIKATQGVGWEDPRWAKNAADSAKFPIHRSPYHYFLVKTLYENEIQARFFYDTVKDYDRTLPPLIDIETTYNYGLVSKHYFQKEAREFLVHIENMFGEKPIIYSSYYSLFDLMGTPEWLSEYDLMLAWYPWFPKPETQWPRTPQGANPDKCIFWQWTEHGKAAEYGASSRNIDLDVFKWSRIELDQYANKEPGKPADEFIVIVTANSLNMRPEPSTRLSPLGFVYKDSAWTVYQTSGSWGKIHPEQDAWIHLGYTKQI